MALDFEKALSAEGVTGDLAALARSIFVQESGGGKNTTTSNRGAVGGMQVTPGAFNEVADKGWDNFNPEHNARAGIRYLRKMHEYAGGDPKLAAVGYYGGKGGIIKARQGVAVNDPMNPHAPNTLQYGNQVVSRAGLQTAPPVFVGRTADGATRVAANEPVGRRVDGSIQATSPVAALVLPEATQVAGGPIQGSVGVPGEGPRGMYTDANAWNQFIRSLPQGRGQVAPEELQYGFTAMPAPRAVVQGPSGRVNFSPFAALGNFGRRRA